MKNTMSVLLAGAAVAATLVGCSSKDEANTAWDTGLAPEAVTWSAAQTRGIKVPSGQDGPKSTEPVPHGWAPSPQGAVLAAMNSQVYMATAGENLWPEVSNWMIAPGQGRDQWAQARALMDIDGTVANPPEFKGFRFSEFSESKAIVVLAMDYPDQGLLGYPVQLDRSSGDWRVVLAPQGQEPDLTPISDSAFDDFVEFGG